MSRGIRCKNCHTPLKFHNCYGSKKLCWKKNKFTGKLCMTPLNEAMEGYDIDDDANNDPSPGG